MRRCLQNVFSTRKTKSHRIAWEVTKLLIKICRKTYDRTCMKNLLRKVEITSTQN